MATKQSQKNNLLKISRISINTSSNLAELKSACIDLVDAVKELKQDLRKSNNRIRRAERRQRGN